MKYFLSLGSNIGNRRQHLRQALEYLEQAGVKIIKRSSIYKTQPVGWQEQPWFYNQVVEVTTALNPYELLALAKNIEARLKRRKTRPNGPRTIDIDLLLAERSVIQTRKLVIPHPRLDQRRFVLKPLAEIAPEVVHPVRRENIATLLKNNQDSSKVIKLKNYSPKDKGKSPRRQKPR